MKKIQEQSFQHYTKKSLEERWIRTNYVPVNGAQAEVNILSLVEFITEILY